MDRESLRQHFNYFLPREVLGPVALVFSLENVVDIIFSMTIPDSYRLVGWSVIFVLSAILIAYWGEVDEDKDDFEDELLNQ